MYGKDNNIRNKEYNMNKIIERTQHLHYSKFKERFKVSKIIEKYNSKTLVFTLFCYLCQAPSFKYN